MSISVCPWDWKVERRAVAAGRVWMRAWVVVGEPRVIAPALVVVSGGGLGGE